MKKEESKMKTTREIEQKIDENKQLDADELMQRMFNFIHLENGSPSIELLSAKFCAMVTCDYLIDILPNINETPPIHRKDEIMYQQYWMGVKRKLNAVSVDKEMGTTLNNLQQNQTKDNWVSVEERLPDDYEWVICGNTKTQKSHYGRYEEDRWSRGREVTHWQPLPKPPINK